MSLRRAIVRYLVILLALMGLTVGLSVVKAPTVSACSWSVEHVNTSAGKAFYSGYFQATDYLYARITTYAGGAGQGCTGNKYYVSQQFTALGTPGTYYTEVRVWVCGGYQGAWASASASVTSPTYFHYGNCVRQADNYSSYFHDTYDNVNVSQYVTQG